MINAARELSELKLECKEYNLHCLFLFLGHSSFKATTESQLDTEPGTGQEICLN